MGIFGADSSGSEPGFSSDLGDATPNNNTMFEKELEDFWSREKEKLQMYAQVLEFNDVCWEKCKADLVGSKLNKKAEACLSNCVDRFLDASIFIINRFATNNTKRNDV